MMMMNLKQCIYSAFSFYFGKNNMAEYNTDVDYNARTQ